MKSLLYSLIIISLVGLSGCIAGNDDAPSTDMSNMDTEPTNTTAVLVEEHTGSTGNAVATPRISVNNGGTYEFPLTWPDNVTGWTLELTWDANGPESDSLDLWIRETGNFAIDPQNPELADNLVNSQPTLKATGGSPLRLAFTPSELNADAEYSILVRAATPAGVAVDQAFALSVAIFDGVPHDPEHTF